MFLWCVTCRVFFSRKQQRKAQGQVRTVAESAELFVGSRATGLGNVQRLQTMELLGTGPDELVRGRGVLAKLFR